MLSISKKTDYGLLLLRLLAEKPAVFLSIAGLAKKHQLPHKYLSQIAGELKMAGLLESREGIYGGYRLAISPDSIPVRQVLEVLEGSIEDGCEQGDTCACREVCVHTAVIHRLTRGVENYSLADLFSGK